jgi:restriction system protein
MNYLRFMMGYRYYRKKREDKRIEAIVYLAFLALFVLYYYRETILKILIVIVGIAFIITILYLIFKAKPTNKPIQKDKDTGVKIVITEEDHITRKNNSTKVHESSTQPINNKDGTEPTQNSLHVNEYVCNMEKEFCKQPVKQRPSYQENKKRGDDYEKHVGRYYENQGYKVFYNGLKYGKKDGGVDLIIENGHETLLIQCKAWQSEIKRRHLVEFIGNCSTFLMDNPHLKEKNIKRVFVTSSEKSELGLDKYLIQHVGKIEYIIMPFE